MRDHYSRFRQREWSYSTSWDTPRWVPNVPAAFAVTCTGLGYAYLATSLTNPLDVVQTLAQTGWEKDTKGKKPEGTQVADESEVVRVLKAVWKQGPRSLWQGHQTSTLILFGQRALPPVVTFLVTRLALRPLLSILPRRASKNIYASPLLNLLLLLDSAAFTSFLLAPLSRRLTQEIFAIGRVAKSTSTKVNATVESAAVNDTSAKEEDKTCKGWLKKADKLWQNSLLTFPLMAETLIPLIVDYLAGSWLSLAGVTGGARRQLSLVGFRLASLTVLTPLKLMRRRLQLVAFEDEHEADSVYYQTVDGQEVEVFPNDSKKVDAKRVWDKTLAGVLGPEPVTWTWNRLRPLYAGWEVDVARVLLAAGGSWVGWKWATAVERRRGKEIKLSWNW